MKAFSTIRRRGVVIFEAFSKKQIDYVTKNANVGGSKDIPSLFSMDELKADFGNYEIIELEEKEISKFK